MRLASARPTILTVGQIAPFKGTHLTVEATLALIAEGLDVQTLVVGHGAVVAAGTGRLRGAASRARSRRRARPIACSSSARARTCWTS